MKKTGIGAALLVASLTSVSAQNFDVVEKRVPKAVSREMTDCAGFFLIASEGVRRGGQQESAKDYEKMAETLLVRSSEISTEDAIRARLALSQNRQRLEMGNDYENFAAMLEKYVPLCQQVHDNPKDRFKHWALQTRTE